MRTIFKISSIPLYVKIMQPHLLSAMSWFIICITMVFICGSKLVFAQDDERYVICSNSLDCGSFNDISYPFWGSNRPDYCGYPGLELNCSNQDPEITIMPLTYKVLDINKQSRTLTVARTDYAENICPTQLSNTTLNPNLLNYTLDDRNMTIYYDCPAQDRTIPGILPQNPCNADMTSYFAGTADFSFLGSLASNITSYLESCNNIVEVPVSQSALASLLQNATVANLLGALNRGFGLEWKANDTLSLCDTCISSGGQCGYNQTTTAFTCYCKDQPQDFSCHDSPTNDPFTRSSRFGRGLKIAIGISAAVVAMIAISIIAIRFSRREGSFSGVIAMTFRLKNLQHVDRLETFMMEYHSLTPKRYSYADIKKLTNSFTNILGQGGFGIVYKGKLPDGRLIAVKVLKESKGDGEEFMNEVASISRTSHVNIVTLLGFCYERTKRALIYEFMPKGSLDKFISYKGSPLTNCRLEWKKINEIAVGIARGLEYLHRGCNTRIVHFDIKPHNILLDEDLCPKISDFGLAKLCKSKVSKVSMIGARGTVGYIAPEVFCRNFGGVTYKSDVYSYGMMVLEMVGERKDFDTGLLETSEMYFPDWFYKHLEPGEISRAHESITEDEEEIVKKMIIVGLWCIQTNPSDRPSMTKVVEMLEGSLELLQIPPRPFLSSPKTSHKEESSTKSFPSCLSLQSDEQQKSSLNGDDL